MRFACLRLVLLAVCLSGFFAADAAAVYNPSLGQFVQRDPAGYVDGMNNRVAHHVMHGGVDPTGRVSLRHESRRRKRLAGDGTDETMPKLRILPHRAWYGNYCGVGIFRRQPDSGSFLHPNPRAPEPINEVDSACKLHDQCWAQVKEDADSKQMDVPTGFRAYRCPSPAHLRCDEALCDFAMSARCDDFQCEIAKSLVIGAFCNRRQDDRLLCPDCIDDPGTLPVKDGKRELRKAAEHPDIVEVVEIPIH